MNLYAVQIICTEIEKFNTIQMNFSAVQMSLYWDVKMGKPYKFICTPYKSICTLRNIYTAYKFICTASKLTICTLQIFVLHTNSFVQRTNSFVRYWFFSIFPSFFWHSTNSFVRRTNSFVWYWFFSIFSLIYLTQYKWICTAYKFICMVSFFFDPYDKLPFLE